MKEAYNDKQLSVYSLFIEAAEKSGLNTVAIEYDNKCYSYGEIINHVNALTSYMQSLGCKSGQRAVLISKPCVDFIVGMLSCIQQGIVYTPIDPLQSKYHLKLLFSQLEPSFALVDEEDRICKDFGIPMIQMHLNHLKQYNNHDLQFKLDLCSEQIYIAFTSGTTGAIKGVPIQQSSVLNLMRITQDVFNVESKDIVPLFHHLSFDFSIWEILLPLLNGAALIIPHSKIKENLVSYFEYIISSKATIVNFTPTVFGYFCKYLASNTLNSNLSVRTIILGGEKLSESKIRDWFSLPCSQYVDLFNMYGITEATIHSTIKKIEPGSIGSPIGLPLNGVEVLVVDSHDKIIYQPGKIGELWLGGAGIATHYINDPVLSGEKFLQRQIEGKFSARWFKTGDLVSWSEDYQLNYECRKDSLIKYQGFRVNIDYVEDVLLQCEGVQDAAIIFVSDEDKEKKQLVVYVVLNGVHLDDVENYARDKLPHYMVPAVWNQRSMLPRTKNNKINKQALYHDFVLQSKARLKMPKNSLSEDNIMRAWAATLKIDSFNRGDNFFDIGGDSLLLIKLHYELEKRLNMSINMLDLVKYPTIRLFYDNLRS